MKHVFILVSLICLAAQATPAVAAVVVPAHPAPHATGSASEAAAITLILLLAAINTACLSYALASSSRRVRLSGPADEWEDPHYLQALPNALALLKAHSIKSAWPGRRNPWSMHFLERRLQRAVQPLLKAHSGTFVRQHLSVWIWVETHRDVCQQLLRTRQVDQALRRLSKSESPSERARLAAFLASVAPKREVLVDFETRRQHQKLERIHAVMREHGYSVTPELNEADSLENTLRLMRQAQ